MFFCKELKLLYATVVLLLEAELLVNTGAMESKRSSILVAQNADDLKSLDLCTSRNQQRLGSVLCSLLIAKPLTIPWRKLMFLSCYANYTTKSFAGHRRRTTTSTTQTTLVYTTVENDDDPTEALQTTTDYVISTHGIHPKLPKPLRLSAALLNNDYDQDVHSIDNILDKVHEIVGREKYHTRHRLDREIVKGLDENSMSKSMNKVKKMYRDSASSVANKLSGKGGKNGIFLTENCTTVIAQIGTTAILHCEVSDITENTVTWIRKKDYSLLSVGLVTYSADSRFFSAHGRHVKVNIVIFQKIYHNI
ncbi:unnamed protein product [Diatraea saccharalis]|uniref:Ig-like domain-containing protein n=1 Tax=Diatraea saccharalis TaxID=40085 RepID=A0A9N9WF42_9NEOP|nr:unnamed protein product [Diatraea saccharalis]